MRIGIITVSRTNNYGAELQAYALQKKLQLLDYDAEIIDYLYYKHKDYKRTELSKPLVAFSKKDKLKQYVLYRILTPLLENWASLFNKKIKKRLQHFEKFHNGHVRFSNQYNSLPQLNNSKHTYDVFVVGSDQVWNPITATSLSPYFLEFAPKDKRRISYASSFGVSEIDLKYHDAYQKYFSNIESVAVREEDGVSLVKMITGKDAERVLDPTLLLTKGEWINVIDEAQSLPQKYVLIYMLHETNAIIDWAYFIKKKYDLEILMVCKRAFANKKYSGITNVVDAGPSQFIELFSKASFVVTNSFHGTAFSVNFNVPFLTVLKRSKANNSRMLNLLHLVGLDKRVVWDDETIESFGDKNLQCDFDSSNFLLNKERSLSLKYLLNNLV